MVGSIRGEINQRIQDGFSIFPLASDAVQVFGSKRKLSFIMAVPQAH